MPETEELISPGRYYLCFCNYATFVVLLIGLTIVAMGVLSYLVVPKRPKPYYVIVNFTDEESEKAPSSTSSPVKRGGTTKPTLAESDVCESRQCNQEADRILGAVNASLDPCDDFYAYVCSSWMKRHQPGGAEDKTSVDYDLLDAYSRFLEGVLSWKNSELPAAKLLFDTCVNPPVGLFQELITMFFYLVGLQRWPYSVADRVLAADVSYKVGSLHRLLGEDSLFHCTVVERRDGTHPAMSIAEPRLLVGHAEDLPLAYFLFLSKAHKALMNHLHKPMHTSVATVEMDLARRAGPKTATDCADPISKCIVKHLNHLPASRVLHWPLLVQEAFGEKMVALNQIVETSNFDYLVSFSDKMPQTVRKTDLLNYLAFRICMVLSPLIGNATLRDHLASIAYGRNPRLVERLPAAHYCLRFLDRFEPSLVMLLAYDRSVTKLTWKVLQHLVLDHLNSTLFTFLSRGFREKFSLEFARHVIRKLAAVKWEPLMPQRFFNKSFRANYFSGFSREGSNRTLTSFFFFWLRRAVNRMRSPFETADDEDLRAGWTRGFLRTWPTLRSPFRRLEIPLPVFDPAMSSDSGLHGFHVARAGVRIYRVLLGYVYSLAYGFYYNTSTSDPVSMFEDIRSCLQSSYAKTSASPDGYGTNSLVDWERTSVSDMLDLLAAKLAFQAFDQWVQKEGLNFHFARAQLFNQRQLFFIYYGLNFCENVNPAVPRGDGDAPSPAWNRVNGPLRHMKEFADAFQCAEDSFMNPGKKCGM